MFRETFDEQFERKGLREKEREEEVNKPTREQREAFHNMFKTKVKPVFYKGKWVYMSKDYYEELKARGEI